MTKTNSTDAILATLIVSKTHIIVLTFFRFLFALAVSVKRIYMIYIVALGGGFKI